MGQLDGKQIKGFVSTPSSVSDGQVTIFSGTDGKVLQGADSSGPVFLNDVLNSQLNELPLGTGVGTSYASSGALRFPYDQSIQFRNASNNGDIYGIGILSGVFTVGDSSSGLNLDINSGGSTTFDSAGNMFLRVGGSTNWLYSSTYNRTQKELQMNNNNIVDIKSATFNATFDNGTSSTGTKTVTLENGNIQKLQLTGSATINLVANSGSVGNMILILTQDATGSHNPSWQGNGAASNIGGYPDSTDTNGEIEIKGSANSKTTLAVNFDGSFFTVESIPNVLPNLTSVLV